MLQPWTVVSALTEHINIADIEFSRPTGEYKFCYNAVFNYVKYTSEHSDSVSVKGPFRPYDSITGHRRVIYQKKGTSNHN